MQYPYFNFIKYKNIILTTQYQVLHPYLPYIYLYITDAQLDGAIKFCVMECGCDVFPKAMCMCTNLGLPGNIGDIRKI